LKERFGDGTYVLGTGGRGMHTCDSYDGYLALPESCAARGREESPTSRPSPNTTGPAALTTKGLPLRFSSFPLEGRAQTHVDYDEPEAHRPVRRDAEHQALGRGDRLVLLGR